MIKGVIYDLDDLMVDSHHLHLKAFDALLIRYGHKYGELPEELRAKFIGRRVIDILKEMARYFGIEESAESLQEERSSIFLKLAGKELKAMPGLIKSLKLFRLNNFKMALASSGVKDYISLVLDKFLIRDYFDAIVSGEDVKAGKPNPETFLLACRKLGLNPQECLVLEDASVGVETAKNAGCRCIAVISPNTPAQNLLKADLVLDSLNEISIENVNSL